MVFKSSPHFIKKVRRTDGRGGGGCGKRTDGQKCIRDFGGENQKKRDHLEDLGVDGRMSK